MGITYNASVVRNGLVLHLDAANRKSYPSTGTAWTDLSGRGNNGILTNNPVYSTANGGYFQFDSSTNYVSISNSQQFLEYTFMFFCKWVASAGSNRPFGLPSYGTYTILGPSTIGYHFNPLDGLNPSTTLDSGVNVGFNNWVHIAVSESRTNNLSKIYVNSLARNSFSRISTSGVIGTIILGKQKAAEAGANCQISGFNLYNYVLTDTEVRQNFEAHRDRYGI